MTEVQVIELQRQEAFESAQVALMGLPFEDALHVTSALLSSLVANGSPIPSCAAEMKSAAVLMLHGPGRFAKIDKDPEVKDFLMSLRGVLSIEDMRRECIQEFGLLRAPSRSGLHRYIQKLRRRGPGVRK